ncbi:IS3 family transposase [Xanthomonas theicola]|uniref:IS3 family transposase n=1 Tax=Xanthomonas theicola TaxID=56464 RepID=UPI00360AF91A
MIQQWQEKAQQTARLCRLLGVSRSGVYAARRRRSAPRVGALVAALQAAFQASGGNYGSRRLSASLKAQGLPAGRHRVRRLMKQQGLKARWKRKFIHTTDSRHDLPVAANVLDRRFKPSAPDHAWVADITYIRTERGWLYLAAVLDLYSRKIVGWAMAPTMPAKRVCQPPFPLTRARSPGSAAAPAASGCARRPSGRSPPGHAPGQSSVGICRPAG